MPTKNDCTDLAGDRTQAIDDWAQTFDGVPDLIAILDNHHRIRRVNRAQASRIGLAPEACIGLSCCHMLHGTETPVANCPHLKLQADHQEHSAEVHDLRTNSDYLVTVTPLFDDQQQLTGSVHVARDITAQKRAEAALRQSVSLLRATLDSTADGILVADLDGRILDFNEQFLQLWHIPRETIDLRDETRALTCMAEQLKYPQQFLAKVQEVYAHPEADSFDLLELRDGRAFERYSRPQRVGGFPIGRVWSYRDVSERKRAEDTLYRQMAFEAMATRFLAGAARSANEEIDGLIHTSLAELGFFAEVDEAYIVKHTRSTWSASHTWHAPAVRGKIQHYHEIPLGQSPWLEARLQAGQAVRLHTLADLPPEAALERERLARDGVVSLLLVPLRGKDGGERGSLGLRSYTRQIQWAPEDIQRLRLLGDAITSTLERRQAENAQHESEARLRAILEAVQTGVMIIDPATRNIVDLNAAAARLIGAPKDLIVGNSYCRFPGLSEIASEEPETAEASTNQIEDTLVRADGSSLPVLKTIAPLMLNGRRHILETVIDISALKQMEAQVAQAQKMDAIGRLAGGVAHDFNNIVQVILGFADIVLLSLPPDHPQGAHVEQIKAAAIRAGEISRRLLSFSRRQSVSPTMLDLNLAVGETLKMVRSLLGADVQVITRFAPDLARIYADAGQITQVVMNLALNARDAMPQGGQLTLSTANVTLSAQEITTLGLSGAQPGPLTCLTVTDNGTGMTDHVLTHLFEPFFTTKDSGKGTGLGLSVVYGIVKQCNGWINVVSRPKAGSSFKLYFPVYAAQPQAAAEIPEPANQAMLHGNYERILLVEDDPNVCSLARKILHWAHYQVVACDSAQEALRQFQAPEQKFELLFCDVVLPDGNGIELADQIHALSPHLPILLCSGYTEERAPLATIQEKGYLFLQKPYFTTGLLRMIRRLLQTDRA